MITDYTTSTKRLGSKTPHGKLVVCPKCGIAVQAAIDRLDLGEVT